MRGGVTIIGDVLSVFDNRELAILIWLLLFLAWAVSRADLRRSLAGLLTMVVQPPLITVFALMMAYVGLLVYSLALVNVWTIDLLGDTLFWVFGPAMILFFRVADANKDQHFFRRTCLLMLRFTVVIEFLVNLYPLNIVAELFLVPVLVFIGGMLAVAASRDDFKPIRSTLNVLLALIGIGMLGYVAARIAYHPGDLATLGTLRKFVLPTIVTLGFLPFLYGVALSLMYSGLRFRLTWEIGDGDLARYARRRVFRKALFRLRTIRQFANAAPEGLLRATTRSEIDEAVERIRRNGA
jgi:hypothetical protein